MPTPEKAQTIADISDELGRMQGAIVTDFRGMTVEQITTLRRRLRPVKARYQVVKNTLLRIALEKKEMPSLGNLLEGPNAVLFADGDPVEAAKVLAQFIKDMRKDMPHIKGGLLGNRIMTAEDVVYLATLPPRNQILGNLVGTVQSPVANLVSTLGAVLSNLVGTVEAYSAKMAGPETPPDAEAEAAA